MLLLIYVKKKKRFIANFLVHILITDFVFGHSEETTKILDHTRATVPQFKFLPLFDGTDRLNDVAQQI